MKNKSKNYKFLKSDEVYFILRNTKYCIFAVCDNNGPYIAQMIYNLKIENGNAYLILKGYPYGEEINSIIKGRNSSALITSNCSCGKKMILIKGDIIKSEKAEYGIKIIMKIKIINGKFLPV